MRKTNRWVQSLVLGLTIVGAANQAHGTLYTIGNGGLQGGWNLNIDGAQDGGGNALVGGILLTPSSGMAMNSVCLDVSGTVYLGYQYNYVVKSFNGQDGLNPNWGFGNGPGNGTPALPANAAAAIQNAAYLFDQHKSVLAGSDTSLKAALQLAIWEVLYDTGNGAGYNLATTSAGRFEASNASSTAAATAMSWIATDLGLYGERAHTLYSGNLLQPVLANGSPDTSAQEMMGVLVPIPEPTTFIAGALLLLPFAASTIRFIRRKRSA